jgi:hypothetical protein
MEISTFEQSELNIGGDDQGTKVSGGTERLIRGGGVKSYFEGLMTEYREGHNLNEMDTEPGAL